MGKTSYNKQEWAKNFSDFIVAEEVTAPHTEIQNRAKVKCPSLKAVMGVERIPFVSVSELIDEFGPNGEKVSEISSKDSRIRFIGEWYQDSANNRGGFIRNTTVSDIVEVTFYGTGLDILRTGSGTLPISVVVDGGSPVVVHNFVASSILDQRNYKQNRLMSITSGLSLGWHTVKLYNNDSIFISGVQILTEASQVKASDGEAFVGMKKDYLPTLSNTDYNAGVTGTKGARVVKYLKDGAISQVVTEVPSSPSYLSSANHTNEEIVRKINHREFGVNRSDDFTTVTGSNSNRAYTLDDGTTTLLGTNLKLFGVEDTVAMDTASTSFMTLTFVGTGLDLVLYSDGTSRYINDVVVDGTSLGAGYQSPGTGLFSYKICSGLPYGTHTVKFTKNSGVGSFGFKHFIIYQPAKPTLPVDAVEICDYNVMATYEQCVVGTNVNTKIATGVLRKSPYRELTYAGGSWVAQGFSAAHIMGTFVGSDGINDTASYTFFGTGFELRYNNNSNRSQNVTFAIDGSEYNSTNFATQAAASQTNHVGGGSFTASTGVLNQVGSDVGGGLIVQDLDLGLHTVVFTNHHAGASGIGFEIGAFDIITPIHINDSSLKIGSLSLAKNTKVTPDRLLEKEGVDLSKAKAWWVFDQTTNTILASNNVAQILDTGTGDYHVYFEKPFKDKNYVTQVTSASNSTAICSAQAVAERTGGVVRIGTRVESGGAWTDIYSSGVVFGELQDEE